MIRPAILLAGLLAVSADAAPAPRWQLTVDGVGPVKIGMTQAQVSKLLKAKLTGQAIEDEDTCVEKGTAKYPGLFFMFEGGKVTRISLSEPSKIRTAAALRNQPAISSQRSEQTSK